MSEPITNAADAVAALGALPMPTGSEPSELEQLRARVDEVERKYTFDTAELKRQLESERVDGRRLIRAEQRRAELEAVLDTHRKDDEAEIKRLREKVAVLEEQLAALTAQGQVLRGSRGVPSPEGEFHTFLHHAHKTPHDLPPVGGA